MNVELVSDAWWFGGGAGAGAGWVYVGIVDADVEGNGLKLDLRGGTLTPAPDENERASMDGALGTGGRALSIDGPAGIVSDRMGAVCERAGGRTALDWAVGAGTGVRDLRDWEGPRTSAARACRVRKRLNWYLATCGVQ